MARGVPRAEPLAVPHQDRPLREGPDTPCSLCPELTRAAGAQGAESGGLLYIMEASGSYNLFVRTANQTNHIHRGSWRRLSPEPSDPPAERLAGRGDPPPAMPAKQQLGLEPQEPGARWCQGWRLCPAGAAAAACPRALFSQHFTILTIDATARGKKRILRLVGFRQAWPHLTSAN